MQSSHLQILSLLLLLLTFTSAWPGGLVQRQNSNSDSNSNTNGQTTQNSPTTSKSNNKNTPTPTPTDTGSTNTQSSNSDNFDTASATNSTDFSQATTDIDPRSPAGGVEMLTPSALALPSYYKIGDYVTFGWNYTSLIVTPTAIDVVASCRANDQIYTIAANQSINSNNSNAVLWDTGSYQSTATVPLLTEIYTLVIYDVDKGISATASPGYLAVFEQFTFGMYSPQAYTPLNEFKCATCSSAISDMERQTLKFLLAMAAVTVFSFTWFVGGLGIH